MTRYHSLITGMFSRLSSNNNHRLRATIPRPSTRSVCSPSCGGAVGGGISFDKSSISPPRVASPRPCVGCSKIPASARDDLQVFEDLLHILRERLKRLQLLRERLKREHQHPCLRHAPRWSRSARRRRVHRVRSPLPCVSNWPSLPTAMMIESSAVANARLDGTIIEWSLPIRLGTLPLTR